MKCYSVKRNVNILKYWYKTQCRSKGMKATREQSERRVLKVLNSNRGNYYGWLNSCCRLDIWYLIIDTWYFVACVLDICLQRIISKHSGLLERMMAEYIPFVALILDIWYFFHALSIATVFTENNHDGWIHSFCRLDTSPFLFFFYSHLHTGW